jgi:protein-L-isoaspartate(D-aspartate) O-methyltransferase
MTTAPLAKLGERMKTGRILHREYFIDVERNVYSWRIAAIAMAKVPRHEFVPVENHPYAYPNIPLPIGFDKTISQPLMVAVMTDLLELKPDDVVLEIGTGLGYQSAVLAELAGKVYSVEIIDELAQRAIPPLKRQGYTNVVARVGNGYSGWPEHAPFDKVIVTAAPDLIPPSLINQLKAGGRMVIPVGLPDAQQLVVAEKDLNGRVTQRNLCRYGSRCSRERRSCVPRLLSNNLWRPR